MTRMHMMTEAQHAQLLDTLSDERYVVRYSQIAEAIAMLKSMQPVSPCAWLVAGNYSTVSKTIADVHRDDGEHVANLYTPEQSK